MELGGAFMISPSEVAATVSEYLQGSDRPDVHRYRERFEEDPARLEKRVRRTIDLCNLGGFFGKDILDVGCGYGVDAVAVAAIGNNDIIGVDILESAIGAVTDCLRAMQAKGNSLAITPLHGDACALRLPDGFFDGILSTQTVGHARERQRLFDEWFRLLRPGGRAVIADSTDLFSGAGPSQYFEGRSETASKSDRMLDPFALRDMLRKSGFRVGLRHQFTKPSLCRVINKSLNDALSKWLLARSPDFILVARKPGARPRRRGRRRSMQ
jgi:SAM-dependent methyltransferase